jgi:hypothetical protein
MDKKDFPGHVYQAAAARSIQATMLATSKALAEGLAEVRSGKKLPLWAEHLVPVQQQLRDGLREAAPALAGAARAILFSHDRKLCGKLFREFIAEMKAETNYEFPSRFGQPIYPSQPLPEVLHCLVPVTGFTHESRPNLAEDIEILTLEIKKTGTSGKIAALNGVVLGQLTATLALYPIIVHLLQAPNSGAAGGKAKAAKQTPPLRQACEVVQSAWRDWRKTGRLPFEEFWVLEGPQVYDKLKRSNKKAAKTLRCGERNRKMVSAKVMKRRIWNLGLSLRIDP